MPRVWGFIGFIWCFLIFLFGFEIIYLCLYIRVLKSIQDPGHMKSQRMTVRQCELAACAAIGKALDSVDVWQVMKYYDLHGASSSCTAGSFMGRLWQTDRRHGYIMIHCYSWIGSMAMPISELSRPSFFWKTASRDMSRWPSSQGRGLILDGGDNGPRGN